MSEQPPPQPGERRPYIYQKTVYDKSGNPMETYNIMDPFGHRENDPVRHPWVADIEKSIPGIQGNRTLFFGHLDQKDKKRYEAAVGYYAHMRAHAVRVPSTARLADRMFVANIIGPATISGGINGEAVKSENTKTTKTITRDEKPSRLSLSRR